MFGIGNLGSEYCDYWGSPSIDKSNSWTTRRKMPLCCLLMKIQNAVQNGGDQPAREVPEGILRSGGGWGKSTKEGKF